MQEPKQQWLFNYMDPEYDVSYDDMESDDYDDYIASQFDAEYNAYLDSLEDE